MRPPNVISRRATRTLINLVECREDARVTNKTPEMSFEAFSLDVASRVNDAKPLQKRASQDKGKNEQGNHGTDSCRDDFRAAMKGIRGFNDEGCSREFFFLSPRTLSFLHSFQLVLCFVTIRSLAVAGGAASSDGGTGGQADGNLLPNGSRIFTRSSSAFIAFVSPLNGKSFRE